MAKRELSAEERERLAISFKARILNVLPAASYQMDKFLQLVDVVVSYQTQTACVEIGPQPRLHLNASFVEKYCKRDEHLLMLILHELYHVILGHTRLFPRITAVHNIAFDALINSMLCHQFKDPVYVEFFQRINGYKSLEERLLRPPRGWPDNTGSMDSIIGEAEAGVIKALYGPRSETATYHEVFKLLSENLAPGREPEFILLGDHGAESRQGSTDEKAVNDELFKGILRDVTAKWPDCANGGSGRGQGKGILDYLLPKPKPPGAEFLIALRRLFDAARILQPEPGTPYAWKSVSYGIDSTTVIPTIRDRSAHSKEILFGRAPLFYKTEITSTHPRWRPQNIAHVYVDVSGSMNDYLPWLTAALDPIQRKGLCRLYAFSTVVDEIKRGRLLSEKIKNTFGTDINCVYKHVIELQTRLTPRKVVVLTDGYTGIPEAQLYDEWKKRKVALYVGFVGSYLSTQLEPFAKSVLRLPKFQEGLPTSCSMTKIAVNLQ